MCVRTRAVPTESVSQLLFRPAGACSCSTSYPQLAPWAAFLRRLAAQHSIGGPLFGRLSSYDTDSQGTRSYFPLLPGTSVPGFYMSPPSTASGQALRGLVLPASFHIVTLNSVLTHTLEAAPFQNRYRNRVFQQF